MKLVIVSHYFESHQGGVEIVAGQLMRAIARHGHDVTWLAGDSTPPPPDAGNRTSVALRTINTSEKYLGIPFPIPTLRACIEMGRRLRRADAVLVNDALYPTSVVAFLAARWWGKPIVIAGHVGAVPYRNPLFRLAMKLANRIIARPLLARADRVAFVSQVTARYFATVRFQAPPELVFNGVDTEIFQPVAGPDLKRAHRHRLGLPQDRTVALYVGRFVEKKGLHLLRRMAQLRPDIVWAFAGWGPVDPRAWNSPNVAVFSGLTGASLAALYQASDLFVLPSTGEGFPLVIQEAMACGLPVVCGAETASADEVLEPLLTGIPLDQREPDAIAAEFVAAVDHLVADVDAAEHRSADRFRLVAERYSWPAAAARYIDLLQTAIERGPTTRSRFHWRRPIAGPTVR